MTEPLVERCVRTVQWRFNTFISGVAVAVRAVLVATLSLGLTSAISVDAHAASPGKWDGAFPGSPLFDDPITACRAGFQYSYSGFTSHKLSRSFRTGLATYKCVWTDPPSFQVLSSYAGLNCQSGTTPGRRIFGQPYCRDDPTQPTPECPGKVGNPIDVVTGVKEDRFDDFRVAGGQLGLTRTYNGRQPFATRFGVNITSNFDRILFLDVTQTWLQLGDGRVANFVRSGPSSARIYTPAYPNYSGVWQGDWSDAGGGRKDVSYKLESVVGGGFKFTDEDGSVENYNAQRRVTSIVKPGGYTLTFNYDSAWRNTSVVDSFGRAITFTYGADFTTYADGTQDYLVDTVTTPDGKVYKYTFQNTEVLTGIPVQPDYSANAQVLTRVTYPDSTAPTTDNPFTSYLYENAYKTYLTGIVDERGIRISTYGYNADGNATSTERAGGVNRFLLAFNAALNQVTVTNPYLKTAIYQQTFSRGMNRTTAINGQASTNCLAANTAIARDSNDYIANTTDAESRVTTTTRNARGLVTTLVRGTGSATPSTTTTTWHAVYQIPTQVVEPSLTTDYVVSTAGNVTKVTQTDTGSQSVPYTTNGQTRVWDMTYTAQGLLDTVNGPLAGAGDTLDFDYDASGYVSKVTNQVGHITLVTSVDGMGRPLSVLDPNGVVSAFVYDPRGRVTSITINPGAGQRQTQFGYDLAGNITQVTRPSTGTLNYTYDNAGRATEVVNNNSEKIIYTYDTGSRITKQEIKNSGGTVVSTQNVVYDELGRVMKNIGAVATQVETLTYDKTDLLKTRTDPRAKVYGQSYDALTRLISMTNPESQSTQRTYDGRDNLATQKDGRNLQTTFTRNGFGDVIREASPDSGNTDFWYDAAGRVNKIVDAASVETNFAYDNAGRMTAKTFPAVTSLNQAFTYDDVASGNYGKGHATGTTDAFGATTHKYDVFGQLIRETRTISGRSYQTDWTYDTLGNVALMTYPSGRQVQYTLNSQGQVTAVQTRDTSAGAWVNVATSVGWNPYGGLKQLDFQSGLQLRLTYDGNYWLTKVLTSQGATTVLDIDIGRDVAGNVTSYTDNVIAARSATFTYSDSSRLATANSTIWGTRTWTYDAAGNRATEVKVESAVTTNTNYVYPATSNRLDELRNATTTALIRDPSYRLNGQMSSDNRVGDGVYDYVYDNNGRMIQAKKAGASIATYGYDAAGRRITRSVVAGSLNRDYIYLPDGRLLTEADGAGATVREYIWLGNMPLAILNKAGATMTTYYMHSGHLTQPLAITDASKAKVWDAVIEPFGAARIFTSTVEMNLRLPGQQLHAETGLSQNWMRDYDPALGRYVQPDPIGLEGGPNVYGYVGQDPLNYIDPDGRFAPPLAPPATPVTIAYDLGVLAVTAVVVGWELTHPRQPPPRQPPPMTERNSCPVPTTALRSSSTAGEDGGPDDRCPKVYRQCANHCTAKWVGRMSKTDQSTPYFRCYNQCLYLNGCGGQNYERNYQ